MSVPKGKRQESQFEVIKHFFRLRKDITDLLLRDFGYSSKKFEKKMSKIFGGKAFEELTEQQKEHYTKTVQRNLEFQEWLIPYQRNVVVNCITEATSYIFMANSIYPSIPEELTERRIYQDKAIGQCFRLLQELNYTIETLPVNIEKYVKFIDGINREINLLKGWRKSDNKYKKNFEKGIP